MDIMFFFKQEDHLTVVVSNSITQNKEDVKCTAVSSQELFFSNKDSNWARKLIFWEYLLLGSQPLHINLWHVYVLVIPRLVGSVDNSQLQLLKARGNDKSYGKLLLLHLVALALPDVFHRGLVHVCPASPHHCSAADPNALHHMLLPVSHVSQTSSGMQDAGRSAMLYGRSCYQHPFTLHVVSRVMAP